MAVIASDPCLSLGITGMDTETPFTISTQADLDVIVNCTSINSTIVVNWNSTIEGIITLPNLVSLGSLYAADDTPLTGFSFPRLTTVTNGMSLISNNIRTLDFPLLSELGGLTVISTPALQTWSGTDSVQIVDRLFVNDHNISSLSFGNLSRAVALSFNFSSPGGSLFLNGPAIPAVLASGFGDTSFVSGLQYMSTTIVKGCNEIELSAVSASSLEIAMNPNLRGFQALNLVSLGPFNQTAGEYLHDEPDSQDALLIANNAHLTSFWFPKLKTVQGTLQVSGNEKLQTIEAFPIINEITGDIVLTQNLEL